MRLLFDSSKRPSSATSLNLSRNKLKKRDDLYFFAGLKDL